MSKKPKPKPKQRTFKTQSETLTQSHMLALRRAQREQKRLKQLANAVPRQIVATERALRRLQAELNSMFPIEQRLPGMGTGTDG